MATVIKINDTTYKVEVLTGVDVKGKKLRKFTTIKLESNPNTHKAEKELQSKIALFEEKAKSGLILDNKITLAAYVERWIPLQELEPKTLFRYKEMLSSRIIPTIGHIKISELQPDHLKAFYNNLKEEGIRLDNKYTAKEELITTLRGYKRKDLSSITKIPLRTLDSLVASNTVTSKTATTLCDNLKIKLDENFILYGDLKALSDRTILHHHRLISSILTHAVQSQIIMTNPCSRMKAPKTKNKNISFYSEQQTKDLLVALETEHIKYKTMVLLDVFTGLRLGELMGLTWDDIDFDSCMVKVSKASQYLPSMGIFEKGTKNESSNRKMTVPKSIIEALKKYRIWWLEQQVKCGDQWINGANHLFVKWNGQPAYTYELTEWFREFIARHNLPHITPHGLRHTCATLLSASGLPIASISKRLGHSRTSTTMDIYIKSFESIDNMAADLLEKSLLSSKPKRKKKA